MEPVSIIEDTRFCGHDSVHRRTDIQTDRPTRWNQYTPPPPPFQLCLIEGIIRILFISVRISGFIHFPFRWSHFKMAYDITYIITHFDLQCCWRSNTIPFIAFELHCYFALCLWFVGSFNFNSHATLLILIGFCRRVCQRCSQKIHSSVMWHFLRNLGIFIVINVLNRIQCPHVH